MKRIILSAIMAAAVALASMAQERTVNRIPTVSKDTNQEQYTTFDRGVWVAAEALAGYSSHLAGHNMGVGEIDVTVGYRFNQFIKLGVGIGGRYYIDQKDLRRHSSAWGMPLFVAARGNMIPGLYRKVVPYWGMELGGSIRDGFMMRPTVGIRVGEPRQAFTLGFSYMGQSIATYNSKGEDSNRFTSFFCLRAGFEF